MSHDPVSALWAWLAHLAALLWDPVSPFWWPTLLAALLLAVVGGLAGGASWRDLRSQILPAPPRHVLARLIADLPWFLINSAIPFIAAPALLTLSAYGAALPALMLGAASGVQEADASPASPVVMIVAALAAFVMSDFALYWTHRLFHAHRFLWRAHRLHHEPAILTPVTAFRFWPQEQVVHIVASTFMTGFGLGVVSVAAGAAVDPWTLLGVNTFTLVWNVAVAHLRHSHVALSFPRWLSHVLVSPHMHQAHHSVDAAQHDRNFGTVFALWDWMFGTLYLPDRNERFRFGVRE